VFGVPAGTAYSGGWLGIGGCTVPANASPQVCGALSLYAISEVLTVPGLETPPSFPDASAPEPGSFWLLGIPLLALIANKKGSNNVKLLKSISSRRRG
jgi:hypothetical protein